MNQLNIEFLRRTTLLYRTTKPGRWLSSCYFSTKKIRENECNDPHCPDCRSNALKTNTKIDAWFIDETDRVQTEWRSWIWNSDGMGGRPRADAVEIALGVFIFQRLHSYLRNQNRYIVLFIFILFILFIHYYILRRVLNILSVSTVDCLQSGIDELNLLYRLRMMWMEITRLFVPIGYSGPETEIIVLKTHVSLFKKATRQNIP